jgi:flagellar basal-body rod protein FlgF
MSSGAYVALSGLQARAEQLNRLASDLANAGTSGYKAERSTTAAAERPAEQFSKALQSAIDVADGPRSVDFRPGTITTTGRDLDLAIEGKGFFAIETPDGTRYTRNGHFTRRADGVLATEEGYAVVGENGPLALPADGGAVRIVDGGLIVSGDTPVGRPQIVDFANYEALGREDGARFRAGATATPAVVPASGARLVAGAIEASNVSVVERMAQLTEVSRGFEALQRGVSILMNDLDGRAITELGRR